jgi:hypothetical protein
MHDNPIPGQTDDAHDRPAEGAVLSRVLELHPRYLSGRALSLDLVGDTLAPRCEVYERAIAGLVAAGLLRAEGDAVVPTQAALRIEEIRS